MMWFDRQHPDAIYGDKRAESHVLCDGRQLHIQPDTVMDFRALPFANASFHLVVFDPPHLKHAGPNSWLRAKYGVLGEDWRSDLRQGFAECFRVLASNGTLIFKWAEDQVKVREVLELAPSPPPIRTPHGPQGPDALDGVYETTGAHMPKETGLMFKGPLVRAILEGRKTQTRRVVKPQPAPGQGMVNAAYCGRPDLFLRDGPCDETDPARLWRCPMGQPGDRIYVRETWQHANFPLGPYQEGTPVFYRADYLHESDPDYADAERTVRRNWLPSIHMPKQAARIWLEITGVRVERLQDMSKADAVRDGGLHQLPATGRYVVNQGDQYFGMASHDPRELFLEIWESTGGDWAANPWVWVIDFKTISTTGYPACARSEA